jgi:hypothetical protein
MGLLSLSVQHHSAPPANHTPAAAIAPPFVTTLFSKTYNLAGTLHGNLPFWKVTARLSTTRDKLYLRNDNMGGEYAVIDRIMQEADLLPRLSSNCA